MPNADCLGAEVANADGREANASKPLLTVELALLLGTLEDCPKLVWPKVGLEGVDCPDADLVAIVDDDVSAVACPKDELPNAGCPKPGVLNADGLATMFPNAGAMACPNVDG